MDISNRLLFDEVFVFFGICDSGLTLSTVVCISREFDAFCNLDKFEPYNISLCPSNDLLLDIKLSTIVPETSFSKTLNYNNNITNSNK